MKRSRFCLLILGSLLFTSCTGYTPTQEMKDFLTGLSGKKAFASISNGHYTEVYQSIVNDDVLGMKKKDIYFDYSNDIYYYYQKMTYEGDQIQNGIEYSQALMCLVGEEYHIYTKYGSDATSDIVIPMEDAKKGITNLIYIQENNYDMGGLYYGDIFAINSTQFPNRCFYIKDDNLYFEEKYLNYEKKDDSDELEEIRITQKIGINRNGLLVESYEKVQIKSSGEGGINTLTPEYDISFDKINSLD